MVDRASRRRARRIIPSRSTSRSPQVETFAAEVRIWPASGRAAAYWPRGKELLRFTRRETSACGAIQSTSRAVNSASNPFSAGEVAEEDLVIDLRVFTNVPTLPACANAISVMAELIFDGLICPPPAGALRSWVVAATRHDRELLLAALIDPQSPGGIRPLSEAKPCGSVSDRGFEFRLPERFAGYVARHDTSRTAPTWA